MRVIIAGSRNLDVGVKFIDFVVHRSGFDVKCVVCGDARGIDRLGDEWAKMACIPVEHYPADWDTHGKRAGYLRNEKMAANADALIAIWDGASKGTSHMMEIANKLKLPVFTVSILCSANVEGLRFVTTADVISVKDQDVSGLPT